MQDLKAEEIIKRWDHSAELYASYCSKYGDINKEILLTPVILEMLGNVAGRNVLDAGCGEGFLSRLIAERGASVTAVDYSYKLLEIARERTPDDLEIEYLHANLERLDKLNDDTFDFVVSCVVLQDLLDYQVAVAEMYRVLRPGGTYILAITHPCFSSDAGWVKDSNGKKLYWKIDNYFYERGFEIPITPGSENNPIGFHRTLTSYYRAILDAGFIIKDLMEPYPSQDAIEKHPDFIDDLRMSHFLVFRLRKFSDDGG
ncbi:MAG: class I SAM-dependent methyltransferase [Anaerolineales bacterium]|jgi:ubiquinone/menaquinone biosynthesis C-methylase UbiE